MLTDLLVRGWFCSFPKSSLSVPMFVSISVIYLGVPTSMNDLYFAVGDVQSFLLPTALLILCLHGFLFVWQNNKLDRVGSD